MSKHIEITSLDIAANTKHQIEITGINLYLQISSYIELTPLDFIFYPPKVISLAPLNINIFNEKYIDLEYIDLSYTFTKQIAFKSMDLDLLPATYKSIGSFNINYNILRKRDIGSFTIDIIIVPTKISRAINTHISTKRVPYLSIAHIDISMGFPHRIVQIKSLLTTYWANALPTNISGSSEAKYRIGRSNIFRLYSSCEHYFPYPNDAVNPPSIGDILPKYRASISTGTVKTHSLKTTIFTDYDTWIPDYLWLNSNISTVSENLSSEVTTNLYAVYSTTLKNRTSIVASHGVVSEFDVTNWKATINYGLAKIWVEQQTQIGYSQFNRAITYGAILSLQANISTYNVDLAVLGLPIISNNNMPLAVDISLLSTNEKITFANFASPTAMDDYYGILTSYTGLLIPTVKLPWLDITNIIKEYQRFYGVGWLNIAVTASTTMLRDDSIKNRKIIYRMYNMDHTKKVVLKLFDKTPRRV